MSDEDDDPGTDRGDRRSGGNRGVDHGHDHDGHDRRADSHPHPHGHDHADERGHAHKERPGHASSDSSNDGHDTDHDHAHHAHDLDTVRAAVVTVSSSRTLAEDPAGDVIVEAFESEGHEVVQRDLIADDFDGVQSAVDNLVSRKDTDIVVTTGGTGVTPDDVTVQAIRQLLDKDLPGFGELFRRRSEAEIGTRVIATRAMAGLSEGVVVFCLPGSENAAALGSELIVTEAPHLAGLVQREVRVDEGSDTPDPDESTGNNLGE